MPDKGFSFICLESQLVFRGCCQETIIEGHGSTGSVSLGAEFTLSTLLCLLPALHASRYLSTGLFGAGASHPSTWEAGPTACGSMENKHGNQLQASHSWAGSSLWARLHMFVLFISIPFVVVRCRHQSQIKALTCWLVPASDISCHHSHISAAPSRAINEIRECMLIQQ